MSISILEALAKQKQPVKNERITCSNGFLSISDAVFGVALFKAGYTEIDEYLTDIKLEDREKFLRQINNEQ